MATTEALRQTISEVQAQGYCVLRGHFPSQLVDACLDAFWPRLLAYLDSYRVLSINSIVRVPEQARASARGALKRCAIDEELEFGTHHTLRKSDPVDEGSAEMVIAAETLGTCHVCRCQAAGR
jgi:hypothetical protein